MTFETFLVPAPFLPVLLLAGSFFAGTFWEVLVQLVGAAPLQLLFDVAAPF